MVKRTVRQCVATIEYGEIETPERRGGFVHGAQDHSAIAARRGRRWSGSFGHAATRTRLLALGIVGSLLRIAMDLNQKPIGSLLCS
jgi:hypothetical protein